MDGLPRGTPAAPISADMTDVIAKVNSVLSGERPIALALEFIFRKKNIDPAILKQTRVTFSCLPSLFSTNKTKQTIIESRSSVLHSSVVFSNSLVHAGTTSDVFLRDNLSWLAHAVNWNKFSAIASLGVIHKVPGD